MGDSIVRTDRIASTNLPNEIALFGFEMAESSAHMMAWLGRGSDFRKFVVNDLESELYSQTPGAQLLAVTCNEKPEFETVVRRGPSGQEAIVTGLSVTFSLTLRVRAADGARWKLLIRHNYEATHLEKRGARQLRLNFTILGHELEV